MKLYVKYPNTEWTRFVETSDTIHQKLALEKFINSDQEVMDISVFYNNWTFTAVFKMIELREKVLYFYIRPDRKIVQFIYLEDNFVRPNGKQHFI
jgi:hypothetical protein